MSKLFWGVTVVVCLLTTGQARAVELLTGGDFEDTAVAGVQGWDLASYATDSIVVVTTAELMPWDPDTTPNTLWLRSFEGGGPELPGDFDVDLDADGVDFLEWQRGNSPVPGSADDLALWEANYGKQSGLKTNAILSQTVPGVAGESYTFQGSSRWEANYSGGVTTLDAGGPLGAIASPTSTTMEMAFLDAGGSVIGTPVTLDLRTEQFNFNFWAQHTLNGTAPAGTASIRVTAEARDMVWNGFADDGLNQAAFYDSFTLTGAGASGTELLANSALDDPMPTGLDPWTVVTDPVDHGDLVSTEGFANRPDSGGDTGVFLKPFQGNPNPVDVTISQIVAGVVGGSYTFSGWSKWETNYSGGVVTLDPSSPYGPIATPTQTLMELAFLDGSDAVIGSPVVLDLSTEQLNDSTWREHVLSGTAPAGTVSVRVSGMMLDGVFNVDPGQAAFFDDFSLDGPTASAAALASVPEPTTAVSLALGIVMLGFGRTRRQYRAFA